MQYRSRAQYAASITSENAGRKTEMDDPDNWYYAYDGDGKRVRGVVSGVTSVYIGN